MGGNGSRMKYAEIRNGIVVSILDTTGPLPEGNFVPCDDDTICGREVDPETLEIIDEPAAPLPHPPAR